MTQGTPKTLAGAIDNGLKEIHVVLNPEVVAELLEKHVRDYLAQKFSVAMIESKNDDEIRSLWKAITGIELAP